MQAAESYPEPVLELRSLLSAYLDPETVALVLRAYEVAEEAHRGQARKTGEPYIFHPVAVAQILANLRMDHESIAAALLHDTIEDTQLDWANIEKEFGAEIADLVEGVTKLDKMKFRTRVEADAEARWGSVLYPAFQVVREDKERLNQRYGQCQRDHNRQLARYLRINA